MPAKRLTRTVLALGAAAAVWSVAQTPAFAHHSFAMFDRTTERTIAGTVSEFRWTNPHGYLDLTVVNSKGNAQKWTIEFQSLQAMTRQGLKPAIFKPGDKVTLRIHPLRNGTTGGDFIAATLADGKVVGEGA